MSNNNILRRLRDEDIIAVTKAELGSLYRKEGSCNFHKCPEQVLRKFIQVVGKEAGSTGS